MEKEIIYIGLDVDDEAFHGAYLNSTGSERGRWKCKPSVSALIKHLERLKQEESKELRICYEATFFGYSLYRELTAKGSLCQIIAPGSVPRRSDSQIKTDRIDSEKLCEFYRAGLLTAIHVPEEEDERVRDLIRSRSFLVEQVSALKNHILNLCRRLNWDYRASTGKKDAVYWTHAHLTWLSTRITDCPHHEIKFQFKILQEQYRFQMAQIDLLEAKVLHYAEEKKYQDKINALICYRGIDKLSALTILTELGDINRFNHPRQLVSFLGLDLREYSSGGVHHRFSITGQGNHRVRKVLVESSQSAGRIPHIGRPLKERRKNIRSEKIEIADRCMKRLYKKYHHLIQRGKHKNKVTIACTRELCGFIWESLREAA